MISLSSNFESLSAGMPRAEKIPMKLENNWGKRVKINSLKCKSLSDWQSRVEKALNDGAMPVVQNFDRDIHLETSIELAFRHKVTVILNPQETECCFRPHFFSELVKT
jgi:hypothetical protein